MGDMRKKSANATLIAMVGVMGALVFTSSKLLSIDLPVIAGNPTRLHMGNVMCLLSGMILGPVPGGIAAGAGSMLFDFADPRYISSAPFTLAFKFLMGFVCGLIAWRGGADGKALGRNIAAAAAGQLTYILLYLGRNFIIDYYFSRLELQSVMISFTQKAIASGINGVIAAAAAAPLAAALRKGLEQAGVYPAAGKRI